MLTAGVLGGCAEHTNAKQAAGAQTPAAADASPGAAKTRIAKICMSDPERFFGSANSPARCGCYGAGVAKTLNKDELSYVVTYNEIPSLASNEYDNIKSRCMGGGAADDDKPAPKKKAAKSS